MLTSYSQAYKTWIFARNAEDESLPIARLMDFVIHPDTGIFEAIWVETQEGMKLISPKDILVWDERQIIISHEQELLEIKEFPSIDETLQKEVPILGAKVFLERSKAYVGKVADFSFDTISPRLLGLSVRSGFWTWGKKRIIPQARIQRITDQGIFISDNTIKVGKKVRKPREEKVENQIPEMDFDTKVPVPKKEYRKK